MTNFKNPRWLLLISTLPVAVLFWIFWGTYDLIKSQLSQESIYDWRWLGATLAILWLSHTCYTACMILRKRTLGLTYAIVSFCLYVPFLYLYSMTYESIIPWYIPRWMIADNLMLYAGTFVMPTLLHSVFVAVVVLTPERSRRKAWPSFVFALLVPLGWYLIFQVVLPFWQVVPQEFEYHVAIIVTIVFIVALIFFLVRGVYMLSLNKHGFLYEYRLLGRVVIAVFFPVAGLVANSDRFFDCIFGNFSDPWFYVLAIVNGVVVILPERDNKHYRLVLFILRSITFSYIIYFFLVFLPYLPLSILAIVAFGLGFLMLTPLTLFVLQVNMLAKDFLFLFQYYRRRYVYAMFSVCLSVLPLIVTVNYAWDRVMLHHALSFMYSPATTSQPTISAGTMMRVIDHIEMHRRRPNSWSNGENIPFLSAYYNWFVLDNLTLSNEKLNRLSQVFEGKHDDGFATVPTQLVSNRNDAVKISDIRAHSQYDLSKKCWISQIDLHIVNESWDNMREYVTQFHLPPGAWIDDYYLWIGDEKVDGLLSERRAATWIYRNVTSYRQDPGILYYVDPETIAFRVFPFSERETRRTGFQIMHKEPFVLSIDNQKVQLGVVDEMLHRPVLSYDSNTVYISASAKTLLPRVHREPVYHFIVDTSAGSEDLLASYQLALKNVIRNLDLPEHRVKVMLCNATTREVTGDIAGARTEAGFFLEKGIERILYRYERDPKFYPIVVTVTDRFDRAILPDNFLHLKHTFAERDVFFELNTTGVLHAHSLKEHPEERITAAWGTRDNYDVVAWPDPYHPKALLRMSDEADIVLQEEAPKVTATNFTPHDWGAVLTLEGLRLSAERNPAQAVLSEQQLVKYAFQADVMMSNTSLIALENDAQREALLKKQKEVLNGHENLDAADDIRNMSEPGFTWMVVIVIAIFLTRKMPSGMNGILGSVLSGNYSFSRKG